MPAPEIIRQLVERFEENRDAYRSGRYNEAQLREEFLNPFFEALGWDLANKKNYAPDYREVVHEDSIDIEGKSKAPDYAFRIGRERKFFVEAKKPTVNIEYDIHPAYQLRRYAWNVHLPLSILTDFEEFAVYDCRNRPNHDDKASTGRTMFFNYKEYVEKWDEIAGIFSPEAIQKGSFEKYAIENRGKKGTTEVDDAFLEDIENWRKLLALNIALRNPQVADDRELNFAVQMTIDRIIFLRICEDKGIELEEQLLTASRKPDIYTELMRLFQNADRKYNSGLFHFKAETKGDSGIDTITPALAIDDKTLKEIIKSIYFPCPYIFKEIPVEILGQVYEQFLGKVIHLTAGHQARVEEKPEVRKAGGVYYTPSYIVDYIVQNTVGKLLEGKTPAEAANLKIVDPACGSGSFLLGVFQCLIDWHEDWYIKHNAEKWTKGKNPALVATGSGGWKLTTSEKKKILLNNIHGVDIDAQAVEVTKLSLLLKVLEEEFGQLSLKVERVLPDLGKNIQCGNSLIGHDYNEGKLFADEEERYKVNPFDWQDAFSQVFAHGGFDVVIGNPPYGASLSEIEKSYLNQSYKFVSDYETSQFFIAKSEYLAREKGYIGFIVPNTLFLNIFAKKFRQFLLTHFFIKSITNLSEVEVFENATVRTTIPILLKERLSNSEIEIFTFKSAKLYEFTNKTDQNNLLSDDSLWINELASSKNSILEKITDSSVQIGKILEVSQGLIPYDKYRGHDEFTIKNRIWNANTKKDKTYKKELRGGDVTRYSVKWNGYQWISYGPWLAAPRKPEFFNQPRLLFREITDPKFCLLHVAFTEDEYYNNPGIINCISKGSLYSLLYILGISNSRLIGYWHFNFSPKAKKGIFPKILVNDVRNIPIRSIDFTNRNEKNRHGRMVSLVERMITLHNQTPRTPQEKESLQREIAATDRQIDKLVYELYGLTEEEIKIVEGV
jgi:type I restriction-modification system DNA methylase subunit